MNEIYNLMINGATDPLEKIIMIVLFFIMFEGIMEVIIQLIKMAGGKR